MHILFCVNNIKFGTKCFVKVEQFVLPFIEDARRFEERMKEKRRETPEQRAKRLKDYELAMKIFKK